MSLDREAFVRARAKGRAIAHLPIDMTPVQGHRHPQVFEDMKKMVKPQGRGEEAPERPDKSPIWPVPPKDPAREVRQVLDTWDKINYVWKMIRHCCQNNALLDEFEQAVLVQAVVQEHRWVDKCDAHQETGSMLAHILGQDSEDAQRIRNAIGAVFSVPIASSLRKVEPPKYQHLAECIGLLTRDNGLLLKKHGLRDLAERVDLDPYETEAMRLTSLEKEELCIGDGRDINALVDRTDCLQLHTFLNRIFDGDLHSYIFEQAVSRESTQDDLEDL